MRVLHFFFGGASHTYSVVADTRNHGKHGSLLWESTHKYPAAATSLWHLAPWVESKPGRRSLAIKILFRSQASGQHFAHHGGGNGHLSGACQLDFMDI